MIELVRASSIVEKAQPFTRCGSCYLFAGLSVFGFSPLSVLSRDRGVLISARTRARREKNPHARSILVALELDAGAARRASMPVHPRPQLPLVCRGQAVARNPIPPKASLTVAAAAAVAFASGMAVEDVVQRPRPILPAADSPNGARRTPSVAIWNVYRLWSRAISQLLAWVCSKLPLDLLIKRLVRWLAFGASRAAAEAHHMAVPGDGTAHCERRARARRVARGDGGGMRVQ